MKLTATTDAYDRSVGRYARELAPRFAAFAGVDALPPGPVLDVGCGPGALTTWLAARVGAGAVAAVDPTDHFVAACAARIPGADVRVATAEALPFRDRTFQAALAQLVLPFVSDGPRAAAEVVRVLRPGGIAAACTFLPDGFGPSRLFWEAARSLDPAAPDDARMRYRREEELVALFTGAGLRDVHTGAISFEVDYDGVDDLCAMFEEGVGPTGAWYLAQGPERRTALRELVSELLGRPRAGFFLPARVVAVAGRRA
jgi:SAM-dependent methyltransferase